MSRPLLRALLLTMLVAPAAGCAVVAVADAAVTLAAPTVKGAAKAGGAVGDPGIPAGDEK